MPPHPAICAAIDARKVVGFDYADDEGNLHHRTLEPYAHGTTEKGDDAPFGYQIAGSRESTELLPGWRLFLVSLIQDLTVLDRTLQRTRLGTTTVATTSAWSAARSPDVLTRVSAAQSNCRHLAEAQFCPVAEVLRMSYSVLELSE